MSSSGKFKKLDILNFNILARLSIQDLEKITIQFEDQTKEILIGEKSDCWRHKVFLLGSCEEYTRIQ